jgi:hypothetical protein
VINNNEALAAGFADDSVCSQPGRGAPAERPLASGSRCWPVAAKPMHCLLLNATDRHTLCDLDVALARGYATIALCVASVADRVELWGGGEAWAARCSQQEHCAAHASPRTTAPWAGRQWGSQHPGPEIAKSNDDYGA